MSESAAEGGGQGVPRYVSEEGVLGSPAGDVTHWGITRKDREGRFKRLTYVSPEGVEIREWPLSELSLAEVGHRWGPGDYRISWLVIDPAHPQPDQRRRGGGSGPTFTILAENAQVHAPASRVAPPQTIASGIPGLNDALALMTLADQRTASSLQAITSLAEALATRNQQGGISGEVLALLLDKQSTNMQMLLQQSQAQHAEQMRALNARLDVMQRQLEGEETEDDAATDSLTNAAKAAGLSYKKGMSLSDMVKQYVIANPDQAFEIVKQVPKVLEGVSSLLQSVKAAPPPAPAPVRRAPRVVEAAPVSQAAPPPSPGLNGMARDSARDAKPAPPKEQPKDVIAEPGPAS